MRGARCPNKFFRHLLLFHSNSKQIRCRACNEKPISVDQLKNVVDSKSPDEEFEWIKTKALEMEKNGEMGIGRQRTINRMIDGIGGYTDINILWQCFETYGVTVTDEVKRLSEMGREEPLNLMTLSDYAFGIRKEHVNVATYGRDRGARQNLSNLIDEINRANGVRTSDLDVLVPLSISDGTWPWNSACCLSKTVVGREVFARRIVLAMFDHLQKFVDEYKKRSKYDAEVWSRISNFTQYQQLLLPPYCDLDLAAMANIFCRPILLLGTDPPFVVNTYVPFLWSPNECKDRNGKNRFPLVLACSDLVGTRVPMVSMAGPREITPCQLPRAWFKSVWGATNDVEAQEMLKTYLHFDQDQCRVATGKYFKPEYLHRFVTAFEKKLLNKEGVHPNLIADFAADLRVPLMSNVDLAVVDAADKQQLLRCLQCDQVTRMIDNGNCSKCQKDKYMRNQYVNGKVQYKDNDHTTTPAPRSWCYLKRKHFKNGIEYDNPPQQIIINIDWQNIKICEQIFWVTGESNTNLNSDMSQVSLAVLKYYPIKEAELEIVVKMVKSQIAEKINVNTMMEHKKAHLIETMGDMKREHLFDDADETMGEKVKEMLDLNIVDTVDDIFASAVNSYFQFWRKHGQIYGELENSQLSAKSLSEVTALIIAQGLFDDNVFELLEATMKDLNKEQRLRLLLSHYTQFSSTGFFYCHAQRLGYFKRQHFCFPLFGKLKFSFSYMDYMLVVCLPGGHYPVYEFETSNRACQFMKTNPDLHYKCDV